MALKYAPFAASVGMVQAAKNAPVLAQGSKGAAVALLQGALIDLKYQLPSATQKGGVPNGIFNYETYQAVYKFQGDHKLHKDGTAGKATIECLDGLMAAAAKPTPHIPPPPVPPPSNAEYKLGTGDPTIGHDPGAGKWSSSPKQVTYIALRASILEILPLAVVTIGDDAAAHMLWYLNNTGGMFTINLVGMVNEVPSARRRYDDEVTQVKTFVELLSPGRFDFTSQRPNGGYNTKGENGNWFYAIGGYQTWGKGTATVTDTAAGREYAVDFEYKFYDRYNWDGGKSVTIGGITVTDAFMGEFHREGIAQEFDCKGSFKRRFTWRKGDPIPKSQIDPPGGR